MAEEIKQTVEETVDQPVENTIDESKFQSAGDESVIKVDLSKPPTDETTETEADTARVVGRDENPGSTEEQEEVQPQGEVQETETPVLEEITEEEVEELVEEVQEAVEESQATGKPLPENIQKLIDFMEETGGD